MKTLKKRAVAGAIDYFVFAFVLAILTIVFADVWETFFQEYSFALPFVFIPLFFRDILFGNASLGKRIVGIKIYDKNWKKPSLKILFKRSVGTSTIVAVLLFKSILVDENPISCIDWERNTFGTMVVDKKVYAEIDAEARQMGGDYEKNMTELYLARLREQHSICDR